MSDDSTDTIKVVPVTTWSTKRQHYAVMADLKPGGSQAAGLEGTALCHTDGNPMNVYDQVALRSEVGKYRDEVPTIADLPECKKCLRRVEALGLEG